MTKWKFVSLFSSTNLTGEWFHQNTSVQNETQCSCACDAIAHKSKRSRHLRDQNSAFSQRPSSAGANDGNWKHILSVHRSHVPEMTSSRELQTTEAVSVFWFSPVTLPTSRARWFELARSLCQATVSGLGWGSQHLVTTSWAPGCSVID